MADLNWRQRYGEGVVIGLAVCVVWAGIAYLVHEGRPWGMPLFYGLMAASTLLIAYLAFVLARRLPAPKVTPNLENIEGFGSKTRSDRQCLQTFALGFTLPLHEAQAAPTR